LGFGVSSMLSIFGINQISVQDKGSAGRNRGDLSRSQYAVELSCRNVTAHYKPFARAAQF
jgi:hypothetical protein